MDGIANENNLVPGQGQPINLEKLKKLASGQAGLEASPASKPRHYKRAPHASVLALGVCLAVAGAMLLLPENGGGLETVAGLPIRPEMPDEGMSQAEQEQYWALASFEPSRFPALFGITEYKMEKIAVIERKKSQAKR